jgi:hypothetical protein
LVNHILSGKSRRQAAEASGVSLRTLAGWLAKARAGDRALAEWVRHFEAAEREAYSQRRGLRRFREDAEAKERWQRFKGQRIAWHLENLGPVEFWRRRLVWLASKGQTGAYARTVARLQAEGFCIYAAP